MKKFQMVGEFEYTVELVIKLVGPGVDVDIRVVTPVLDAAVLEIRVSEVKPLPGEAVGVVKEVESRVSPVTELFGIEVVVEV